MHEWKQKPQCLLTRKTIVVNNKPVVQGNYVFRPFPDCCKCGIVVPYTLSPPDGGLMIYHSFLRAIWLVQKLHEDLQYFKQSSRIEVVLFQWYRPNLPTSKDVLEVFNAHPDIIERCLSARALTKTEFKHSYQMLMTSHDQMTPSGNLTSPGTSPRFSFELYSHLAEWVSDCVLLVECDVTTVQPTPCFILTPLSEGWMGGILYAR